VNRLHEQLGYAYDPAGNLNRRTNNALVQTFGVNSLNELTTVTRSGTLTVAGTTTSTATNVTVNGLSAWLYNDAAFAKDGFSLVDGENTFTAIAQDSYGRTDTNTVTTWLPESAGYLYDLNGNLLSDGKRGFAYDDENQLITITVTNGWKSEFQYDGKMRRRVRKEFTWAGAWAQTNEVRYIYDGNLVVQERHLAPQLSTTIPQQVVSYTRGDDLSGSLEGAGGIGGLLGRTGVPSTISYLPATSYYHCDGNGNITALVNANHALVAKYHYDPYGNIVSQSGPLAEANFYRFSSKELHKTSGLIHYLHRYYEPNLQRWLSRDPIEEKGGLNLYGFVKNAPVDHFDIHGMGVGEHIGQMAVPFSYLCRCYFKMRKAQELLLKFLSENNYECNVNGHIEPIEKFPDVVDGSGCTYGVYHCLAGYFAKKLGADNSCLTVANYAHELNEALFHKEIRKNGGWGGWIRDTTEDMTLVYAGAQLDSPEACIPTQCRKVKK
jgi:RHS repeat-associated protein